MIGVFCCSDVMGFLCDLIAAGGRRSSHGRDPVFATSGWPVFTVIERFEYSLCRDANYSPLGGTCFRTSAISIVYAAEEWDVQKRRNTSLRDMKDVRKQLHPTAVFSSLTSTSMLW